MKLFKLAAISCMLIFVSNFTYAKPPKYLKGSAKDLEVMKGEATVDLKFDYTGLMIAKMKEKAWVAKQKQKGVDDPKQAEEEFNKFWYGEVIPHQEEEYLGWYNKNCKELWKLAKDAKSKYTLTVKPQTLFPYNNLGQIAVLTSTATVTETASGKVLAIIEIPNINAAVPALKERISMTYGGAGRALALFILEGK